MPKSSTTILSVCDLGISYGGAQAVRGVSFDVRSGEILGIVGESGSGKSSVLRALAGLLGKAGRVSGGSILFEGSEMARKSVRAYDRLRGKHIAYVFQDPTASLDPLFRIRRQFDECLRVHDICPRSEYREVECALLREMGFDDPERVLNSYPHEISGGMCQRVVLAMSAALRPTLMLADEPTSALDVTAQKQVSGLLLRLREEYGCSIIVVSHNIAALSLVADRIGVMRKGELVEMGSREQILYAPEHPYTKELIAAVPGRITPSADAEAC